MINKRPTIKFTKEGYEKLKTDFQKYTEKRVGAVVALRTAREMGDLSENGAYKAARFELSGIDREIRRLTYLIRFGQITESQNKDTIDFGAKVTLKDGDKTLTFLLVDGYESDPKEQKLSVRSPIGKAIVGKKVGDVVTVKAPLGEKTYQVVSIT